MTDNDFLDMLDQDDFYALRAHLTRNMVYSPFWRGVDAEQVKLAIDAWTAPGAVEQYTGGERIAIHVPTSINTTEQLVSWCREHMDAEQLGLLKKHLAKARRRRRVYLHGKLYDIKDELKARFKAKWDSRARAWHVHYKQAEATKAYIQEVRNGS